MSTKIKRALKKSYARFISNIFPSRIARDKTFFRLWEKKGYHITPVFYEEPIPLTTQLNENLWQEESKLAGINMNEAGQINLLTLFASNYRKEYEAFPRNKTGVPYQYYINNNMFECIDGEILYCIIREFKPKKILEIGSGFSTYLSAQAIIKNREETDQEAELISVEPYPNEVLKNGFPGLSRLRKEKVQQVPLTEFERLKENDILFIDSSHSLKIGSDVQLEFLDILPRLNKGVIVQIHDIFLPAEYPRKWVMEDFRFLNEQYLLQAFLAFNDHFEVLWGSSYMYSKHPEKMETAISSFKKGIKTAPGSFWIKKIK